MNGLIFDSLNKKKTQMKKVLWFSRHKMTIEQKSTLIEKLGQVEITQLSGTVPNVHVPFEGNPTDDDGGVNADKVLIGMQPHLKELVKEYDEVAVVLPIGMLQQLLPFVSAKRLLQAKNLRQIDDTGKATFIFDKWEQIKEIKIVLADL